MISLNKLLEKQLLLDPYDLEPFDVTHYQRALKWIRKFKPKLGSIGDRPTYMITDSVIEKANKEAYRIFCARFNELEKSKQKYEAK